MSGAGNHYQALDGVFQKRVTVFDIPIYGTAATDDAKMLHAANVMAQYLDNDEDGTADNAEVVARLQSKGAALLMARDDNEIEIVMSRVPESDAFQDLYASETHPEGNINGEFDASLEEVLHLITHVGYADVYPAIFGEATGSAIADAMDIARGGRFVSIPASYPAGAWYTYDDATCNYSCMVTEYTYWALTSILGAQDFPGRLDAISQEWQLNTAAKVETSDPAVFAILTDPQYKLATVSPDGHYDAASFEITVLSSSR